MCRVSLNLSFKTVEVSFLAMTEKYHQCSHQELCEEFNSDLSQGLSDEQVILNSSRGAKNVLSEIYFVGNCRKYVAQLFEGFAILLWIGGILCLGIYFGQITFSRETPPYDNLTLGCTMLLVIFINAGFAYYQEHKIGNIMENLRRLTINRATVVRNGSVREILANKLVPGDLVILKAGDRIPADLRMTKCENLRVNNSALTGESKPEILTIEAPTNEECSFISSNMSFLSAFVVEGTGEGIVIATGDDTLVGQIGRETMQVKLAKSPLAKELTHFIRIISCLAVLCGIISGILTLSIGYGWSDSVMFMVALSLANIPLGLPYFITIFLAIVAQKLSQRNCLAKSLNSVETLGSATVICTDKTGTLTENRLSVSKIWSNYDENDEIEDVTINSYNGSQRDVSKICRAAILCNNAVQTIAREMGHGDSIDEALLNFMDARNVNIQKIKRLHQKLGELLFNSERRYHAALYQVKICESSDCHKCIIVMKGAPEIILKFCTKMYKEDNVVNLTSECIQEIDAQLNKRASLGERVIAIFEVELEMTDDELSSWTSDEMEDFISSKELCFIGLVSFQDPVRIGAREFVTACKHAGIKMILVTGDHERTAQAVASKTGIFSSNTDPSKQLLLKGMDISQFDEELKDILRCNDEIVLSRMSPSQKLQVVKVLQSSEEIVAVLGDGMNDCMALKAADIGITIGENASEVSKEISHMVLLDGNISSLVFAIELGRLMFANLKKCCYYSITDSMPFIVPFVAFIVLKIPQPLGAMSMIVISLTTDMLPAISLVLEKPESLVMNQLPRNPRIQSLVTTRLISYSYGQIGMMEACAGMFSYFVIMAHNGFLPAILFGLRDRWDSKGVNDLMDSYEQEWTYYHRKRLEITAQTGFFIAVILTQMGNLIISRAKNTSILKLGMRNWFLNFALCWEMVLALLFVYTPSMEILGFSPLRTVWWAPPLPFVFYIVMYNELLIFCGNNIKDGWMQNEFTY